MAFNLKLTTFIEIYFIFGEKPFIWVVDCEIRECGVRYLNECCNVPESNVTQRASCGMVY